MKRFDGQRATVVGGGLVGCLLAVVLARRGFEVTLYEKRSDPRQVELGGGRSINLVLTRRGLRGLDRVGLRDRALELTVPVLGRMMHDEGGELIYTPYGKDPSECNHSISRNALNLFLLDEAAEAGVKLRFEHALIDADLDADRLRFETPGGEAEVESALTFGCDGAPSGLRDVLTRRHGTVTDVALLDDGYKELLFPAAEGDQYAMAGHALHIWARGAHFLMGLANLDGSFTGTLYMPKEGPESFAAMRSPADVRAFFEEHYADAVPLLEDFEEDIFEHPTGLLGTVRCDPWYHEDKALLLGDAAHAIVPFFGQGLNCGFEDVVVLDGLLDEHGDDLATLFARFNSLRRPNADAIADMALENYDEMREKVADERFILRKRVESRIEKRWPHRYRSRYAMVVYSHMPYQVAYELGLIQDALLETLIADISSPDELDLEQASALIDARFTPELERRGVSLDF